MADEEAEAQDLTRAKKDEKAEEGRKRTTVQEMQFMFRSIAQAELTKKQRLMQALYRLVEQTKAKQWLVMSFVLFAFLPSTIFQLFLAFPDSHTKPD